MHSAQSKEKIGSSLRQLWAKRLKRKRSTDKFYSSWAESIAEAARRGGINEKELNWDSYEILKEEIASRQLQRAAEKAKEKESKRIRAEKRARERAKKMASQVRKKMDHKQKDVPRAKRRGRVSRGRREEKEEPTDSRESNSKAGLTKANGRKVIDGAFCSNAGVMVYLQSALEKLDIESIKKELGRTAVSLADQIQAAKRKRTQAMANGSPTGTTNLRS